MYVTTITYYTLALADFSAINYCVELSHTLHLNTSKLSPKSHSANSLHLLTDFFAVTQGTELNRLRAPLINPQLY
jgi:hypothetical protein